MNERCVVSDIKKYENARVLSVYPSSVGTLLRVTLELTNGDRAELCGTVIDGLPSINVEELKII